MRIRTLLAVSLLASLPAMAAVQWRGDFETNDISQWTNAQRVSADRIQIVDNPVRQGAHAAKITVKQGDNPINASGNRNELVLATQQPEGKDTWYRWQTMFANDFPSAKTWQLFAQWHQPEDCCGSPPIQFYVYGEEMRLTLSTAETQVWQTPLVRGVWHDFIVHVKFSDDATKGFLELWYDGQQVLQKTYAATRANDYLKLGLYRSNTVTQDGVLYQDGMMQADTYQDLIDADTPPAVLGTATTVATNVTANGEVGAGAGTTTTTTATTDDQTGTIEHPLYDPANPETPSPNEAPKSGGCSTTGGSVGTMGLFAAAAMMLVARRRKRAVVLVRK